MATKINPTTWVSKDLSCSILIGSAQIPQAVRIIYGIGKNTPNREQALKLAKVIQDALNDEFDGNPSKLGLPETTSLKVEIYEPVKTETLQFVDAPLDHPMYDEDCPL